MRRSLLPSEALGKIQTVNIESPQTNQAPPAPIKPCSIAELDEFGRIIRRLGNRGIAALTSTVWARPDQRPKVILTGIIGIACALLALATPTAAGLVLVLAFALWTLEAAGYSTPLSWASPKRATQDAFSRSGAGNRRSRVLLLVRTSSPRRRSQVAARLELLTWPAIGIGIVLLAALAGAAGINEAKSGSSQGTLKALEIVPCLFFLAAIGVAILGTTRRLPWDAIGLSGLKQAMEAIELLQENAGPAPDLMIVGAATEGRDRRVLRQHRECATACRAWEYESGEKIVEELRALS